MNDVADARRALLLLDLTDLGDRATAADTDRLCERAVGPAGSVAAVCLWPRWVARAVERLDRSGVRIATVVNFPDGGDDIGAVVAETAQALDDGADEVDMVLPYRSFAAGRVVIAASMIDAVRAEVAAPQRLKVILETGELAHLDAVRAAARLAIDHGADFVKSSTGKTTVSATRGAVEAMLHEIVASGRPVGIKPSGGIRTLDDARGFLHLADTIMGDQWASPTTFRFGASGLLDVLEAIIAGTDGSSAVEARTVESRTAETRPDDSRAVETY